MEVISSKTYLNFLHNYLENKDKILENKDNISNELIINIYLTLLYLSNYEYKESLYQEEQNIIENFLRKINNLKVKIQLKRKETEINTLLEEITNILLENSSVIDKYNKNNIDVIFTLNTKDSKEITTLIDKLTKEKQDNFLKQKEYDELRNNFISFKNNHYIYEDNKIILLDNDELLSISDTDFYQTFSYLLNIDTYNQILLTPKTNRARTIMISNIINLLKNTTKDNINNLDIPIILTYLSNYQNISYDTIDTSDFNIENIKITELYGLASNNINNNPNNLKWNKVSIPNDYLFNKIYSIIKNGTYYFQEDKFIMEQNTNLTNEFKLSININDIYPMLKNILLLIKGEE